MRTIYLKFIWALLAGLLVVTQARAETIDLGSPYGYSHHSFLYDTSTPGSSDSYGSSNNDIHYKFRINAPTVLLVHHAGSGLTDTSMYLLKKVTESDAYTEIAVVHDDSQIEETEELQKNILFHNESLPEELAMIQPDQAFICIFLEMGDYDLICEGNYLRNGVNNGEIHTTFDILQAGMSMDNPIDLGTQNCSFSYHTDGHYNVDFTGRLYIYYKIQIDDPMIINVEAQANARMHTYIYDEQKQEVAGSDDGNIKDWSLKPGIYYVHLSAYGRDLYLQTALTGKTANTGNCFGAPIQIVQSPEDGSVSFGMSCNTTDFTDHYQGRNTNDVFFALHLEDSIPLQIKIDHIEMAGGMELTLMNSRQEEIALFTVLQDDEIKLELSPGTHYLICEGIETDGMFQITIEGELPKEPELPEEPEKPQPGTPESMESYSPSANLNYIRTITPTVGNDTIKNFSYLSKAIHSIRYFDHLGRPAQEVAYKSSPDRQDITTHHEYDGLGRNGKQWLPIVRTDKAAGAFMSQEAIVANARNQYSDESAFSYSVYENSPLNRIVESYGPGESWQNGGHGSKNSYRINTLEDRCLYLSVGGTKEQPQLLQHGIYPAYELDVIKVQDEEGHTGYSFTNKEGHAILQRSIADNDTLDTYSVYDDFGNLCFVLPPMAVDNLTDAPQAVLDKYTYQYRYDYRNRCIGKKLPGCSWTEQIYDHNNRLLFSQDGEQRKRKEWSFYITDMLDRQVLTGVYHGTPDRDACDASDMYAVFSTKSGDNVTNRYGYLIHCPESIFSDSLEILQANYYDAYDQTWYLPGFTQELEYTEDKNYGKQYHNKKAQHCKGLLTGTMTRVLGNDQELYASYYYDYYQNLIQSRRTSISGKTIVSKSAFNFSGQPVATCEEYGNDIQLQKRYTYDHTGRLKEEGHIVNSKDTTRFVYGYDSLGKVKRLTRIHGRDSLATTNDYNIRNWITGIHSPVFRQTLHYTDGMGIPCFNGNISSMTWSTDSLTTRGYKFTYDGLSRLKNAIYGEGSNIVLNPNRFNEQITGYDKQGNILGLKRYGQISGTEYGMIDNLKMDYTGNQLQAVKDNAVSSVYGGGFDFKDGANKAIEYEYDTNGNLTKDLNKNITGIQYNYLNLPSRIQFEDGNAIFYFYSADGVKLRTIHVIGTETTTTDYSDNAIYENGVLDKLLTEYGYVTLADTIYHYNLQDHQGNNRMVVNQNGTVEEVNHYYPFGGLFTSSLSVQSYKYNGKELDKENGLDWYDYGARHYDAALGRFTTMDPMSEKLYPWNPYAYCLNNPVKFVDEDGKLPVLLVPVVKGAAGGILDFGVQIGIGLARGDGFSKSFNNVDWMSVGTSALSSALGPVGSTTAIKVAKVSLEVVDAAVDISWENGLERSTLLGGEKSVAKSVTDGVTSVLPGVGSSKTIKQFDNAITTDLKSKAAATLTKEAKAAMKQAQFVVNSKAFKAGVEVMDASVSGVSGRIGTMLIEELEKNRIYK